MPDGRSLLLGLGAVALLVGESDNAFADIYSAAVSTQNVAPDVSQRGLAVAVGAAGFRSSSFALCAAIWRS